MTAQEALHRYVPALLDLAEGRTGPGSWLAWWEQHGPQLRTVCSPGVFLRLKPRGSTGHSAALFSQEGACRVLDTLGIAYVRSDRYRVGWHREFAAMSKQPPPEDRSRVVAGLARRFPGFAAFLAAHPGDVESCLPGLGGAAITRLEGDLGLRLPAAYRDFLRCAREVVVGDTLQLTAVHPYVHDSARVELPGRGMLTIADFWLHADGDQALLDVRGDAGEDPPVYYYDHGRPEVRLLAGSFTAWVEELPRLLGR